MFALVHASDPARPVRLLSGLLVGPHPRALYGRFRLMTGFSPAEVYRRGFTVRPLDA